MKTEKSNKGVIALLVVLVVVLATLCVLFATDTISIKNNKSNYSQNNENNNKEEKTIDESLLNELYDIVGIPSTNNQNGTVELSYYISNNDYIKNADFILDYTKANVETIDNVDISPEECAPSCKLYTKENAEKLIKIYNLPGDINEYFIKSLQLENTYINHTGGTGVMTEWNGPNAGITHNVTSEYFDNDNIRIIDKQVINKYNLGSEELETSNQTAIFEFKKENNEYYLNKITIE